MNKLTKIIATVGPSTDSREKLIDLYNAWVNVIRFNFSHANYEKSEEIANIIKDLNNKWLTNLSLLLDTKWPEIRTWDVKEKINYEEWDIFKIYIDKDEIDKVNKSLDFKNKDIFCDYKYLAEDLNIWDTIVLDSGLFNVEVLDKNTDYLEVKALNDALFGSRRHVNLPGIKIKLPGVTDKDRQDILWWIKQGFHFIALSFVRNRQNIEDLRKLLKDNNAEYIKIISKIENQEAIDNMDEIIDASDWVMVARWDLWIEVPIVKLPVFQKQIVKKCKTKWKISIVATHMLETMIDNRFPTRAEVSDVFNTVYQKPDSLMLSWETAIWDYPIETVKIMTEIIESAEEEINYSGNNYEVSILDQENFEKKSVISWAFITAQSIKADAIVICTESWFSASLASAYKMDTPILAFTNSRESLWYMNLLFWVNAFYIDWDVTTKDHLNIAIEYIRKNNLLKAPNSRVISISDVFTDNWRDIELKIMGV